MHTKVCNAHELLCPLEYNAVEYVEYACYISDSGKSLAFYS